MKTKRRQVEPEFSTRGDQPAAAAGRHLLSDPEAAAAMHREQTAEDVAKKMQTVTEPDEPKVQAVRPKANTIWDSRLISRPVNEAFQVLSRDHDRITFDITNQSLLVGGTTATCYLFGAERDAEGFANGTAGTRTRALANGIHCTVLPDGAGRTMTHGASIWAVFVSGSATFGVLDLSIESKDRA